MCPHVALPRLLCASIRNVGSSLYILCSRIRLGPFSSLVVRKLLCKCYPHGPRACWDEACSVACGEFFGCASSILYAWWYVVPPSLVHSLKPWWPRNPYGQVAE